MDAQLQANFGADISEFLAKMQQVVDKLSVIGEKGSKMGEQSSKGLGDIKGGLMDLLPALGIAEVAMKGLDMMGEAFKKFGEHKKDLIDLGTALKTDGVKNVDAFVAKEEAFAESMQDSTNITRDDIMALQAHAAALGVQPASIDDTVKASEGLAKALGVDTNSAMKMVTAAADGNFTMLQRYHIPAVEAASTAQQKFAAVMKISQNGLDALTANTQEGAGPLKNLSNKWEDIQVTMGEALAKAINPMLSKISQFMPTIIAWGKVIMDVSMGPIKMLIDTLKIAFYAAEALFNVVKGNISAAKEDWNKLKDAAKDMAVTVISAYEDVKNAVQTTKDDMDKPIEVKAPTINAANIGKGQSDSGVKDTTEKFKSLTTIMHEAYSAMEMFGKSRPEALQKELDQIVGSMNKIEELGPKATAKDMEAYNELAAAAKKVKGDIDQLKNSIDATNDDKGSAGSLLNITNALEKVQSISDLAKAHLEAFGDTPLEALKSQIEEVKKAMEDSVKSHDTEGLDIYKHKLSELSKQYEDTKLEADKFKQAQQEMGNAVGQAGQEMGNMLGQVMQGKKFNPFGDIMKLISQMGRKFGEKMIALGVSMNIALPGSGLADIIGGGAIIAASTALGALKMASGGIVSGSTFANIGEYAGASHNPEVVAPLDKLRNMMGGGQSQHHTFEIQGDKLVSILQRVNNNSSFTLGGQ